MKWVLIPGAGGDPDAEVAHVQMGYGTWRLTVVGRKEGKAHGVVRLCDGGHANIAYESDYSSLGAAKCELKRVLYSLVEPVLRQLAVEEYEGEPPKREPRPNKR
jgi:hypothetical protein